MKILKVIFRDSLYKNSLYLMINAGIMALLGFVFWTLAARYFTIIEVGLAATLISAVGIILSLSLLGFNVSLIRYLPHSQNKSEIIWSTFWLSGVFALILGVISLFILQYIYPELGFIKQNLVYGALFVLFCAFNTVFNLIESVFIAYRKSKLVLYKNTLWSVLKLLGIILFVGFGAYGIFMGWYLALIIAFLISLGFIGLKVIFNINFFEIKRMLKYSLGNYLGTIFAVLPGLGLPLFITYFLGVEQTAYFYISWMIANLLFFVPTSVGRSFLSEGTHNKKGGSVNKALSFTYTITIIGVILGLLGSKVILSLFGELYVENGLNLLYILILSSLFYSYNAIMVMNYNLQNKVKNVILIYVGIALFTFVFVGLLMDYGLLGIGLGWLIANVLVCFFMIWRRR